MTTYFISRHSGAIKSVAHQHMPVDQCMAHLDPAIVQAGRNLARMTWGHAGLVLSSSIPNTPKPSALTKSDPPVLKQCQ